MDIRDKSNSIVIPLVLRNGKLVGEVEIKREHSCLRGFVTLDNVEVDKIEEVSTVMLAAVLNNYNWKEGLND